MFCRRSCRQRAYEARRRATELGLGEHELVVTRQELDERDDRLWLIRRTLDDVVESSPDQDARSLAEALIRDYWDDEP